MSARNMPDYAGLREWRRSRQTGTRIGLYDGQEADLDTSGGRWSNICEDHGEICNWPTIGLARSFMAAPEEWCSQCATIAKEKK
jgi:hypothetical protein